MDTEDKFLHNLRKTEKAQHQAPSHNAWERIHKKMEKKKSKKFFNRSLYWQGMAASFLLICFVSVIYYFFNKSLNKPGITQAISTQTELKPQVEASKTEDITNNNANESQKKIATQEAPPAKGTKKEVVKAPKLIYTKPVIKADEADSKDQSLAANTIASGAATEAKEKSMSRPAPAAMQSKMNRIKDTRIDSISGFNLLPPEASGLWAGKMNNANYTASLKKNNNAWVLLGQHSNIKGSSQTIIIGLDDISIQTQDGVKTYLYKNTTEHQARFENKLDDKDYVTINYIRDKLEIFQSAGNALNYLNKPTANQWKLVKSYE